MGTTLDQEVWTSVSCSAVNDMLMLIDVDYVGSLWIMIDDAIWNMEDNDQSSATISLLDCGLLELCVAKKKYCIRSRRRQMCDKSIAR